MGGADSSTRLLSFSYLARRRGGRVEATPDSIPSLSLD